jgi:hypothetical protein
MAGNAKTRTKAVSSHRKKARRTAKAGVSAFPPLPQPAWDHHMCRPTVCLEEAVALSCNIDPGTFVSLSDWDRPDLHCFEVRLDLARQNAGVRGSFRAEKLFNGLAGTLVSLHEFARWAVRMANEGSQTWTNLPTEFRRLALRESASPPVQPSTAPRLASSATGPTPSPGAVAAAIDLKRQETLASPKEPRPAGETLEKRSMLKVIRGLFALADMRRSGQPWAPAAELERTLDRLGFSLSTTTIKKFLDLAKGLAPDKKPDKPSA